MLETKTYDCLFTQRIDSNIKALISNALGNHFPSLDAVWLIQRWHPHNVAWAENLTDVFFDFLKPLSRTHLLTNDEINGSAYGFEPEYTADLPDELNLPTFPDEVIFKVPKGKSASISWIERSHDVVSSSYCDKLTNEITCWHRSQRLVTAKDSDLEIKLDSRSWLINSCVIQGDGALLNLSSEQAQLILYQYANQTLEEIYDQLNLTGCQVLTGCDVEFQAEWLLTWPLLSDGITLLSEYNWGLTQSHSFSNPLFLTVPDNYFFVAYQRAGEETQRGRELTYVYDATSEELSLHLVYDEDSYFKEWKKTNRYNALYEEITLELPDYEFLKGDTGKTLGVIPSVEFRGSSIAGSLSIVLNPYRDFRDGILPSKNKSVSDLKNYLSYYSSNGIYPDESIVYLYGSDSVYKKEYFIYDGIDEDADDVNIIWESGKGRHWRKIGSWLDFFGSDLNAFWQELDNNYAESPYSNIWITRGPAGKRSRFYVWDRTLRVVDNDQYGNPIEGVDKGTLKELLSDFDGGFRFVSLLADCDLDLFSSGEIAYFNGCLNQARTKTQEWIEEVNRYYVDPRYSPYLSSYVYREAERYYIHDQRKITRDLTTYRLTINYADAESPILNLLPSRESQQVWEKTIAGNDVTYHPDFIPEPVGIIPINGTIIWDSGALDGQPISYDHETFVQPFRDEIAALFPDGYHRATKTVTLRRDFRFQQRPGRFVVKSWDDDNNYYLYRELSDSQAQAVLAEFNADPDNKPGANNHTIITLFSGENPVIIEFDRPFFDPDCDGGDIMPDSRRAIETYERLKLVSDFLGVGVDIEWEGENVSFVSKEFPDPVFVEEPQKQIPPNWSPFAYQVTQTDQTVEAGLVFEARSNLIAKDKFGKEEIRPGGVIKCHNLLQRLDLQHDDIEKMLGGQEAGGLQIPRADKTGVMTYEGQTAMIADILYMLSCLSLRIEETNINAIRTVALNQAILRALGLPVEFEKIPYATNGDQGEILVGKIPENAPTLTDLIGVILQNLGKQVAGQLSVGEVKNG